MSKLASESVCLIVVGGVDWLVLFVDYSRILFLCIPDSSLLSCLVQIEIA